MQESPRTPQKSAYLITTGVTMAIISTLPICRLIAFWRPLNKDNGENRISPSIILNKNHPNYESGTGRQFLLDKWVDLPCKQIVRINSIAI